MNAAEPLLARIPAGSLATLADLRREAGLYAADGEPAWLLAEGTAASPELLHRLMAIPRVALFERRDGAWFPRGGRLPASDLGFDRDAVRPLAGVLLPEPFEAIAPTGPPPEPAALRLVRDPRPRPTTALVCPVRALASWADLAPSAAIEALSAAVRAGEALVRGRPLPPIDGADRLWGRRVLCPLGWRPDPELPEPGLRAALVAGEDDLVLLGPDGSYDLVPEAALTPLTRASARLAADPARGAPR